MDEVQQPLTAPENAPRVSELCAADLTATDAYVAGPPHGTFDLLRAAAPVAWNDEKPRMQTSSELRTGLPAPVSPGFWVVTSHPLVEEVSKSAERFSSALGGTTLHTADAISLASMRLMMLNMDAPEHVRLRKIVAPSFSPRSVSALREFVIDQCRDIVDGLVGSGSVDFVDTVAKEITTRILARMLGMPQADRHLIVKWSDALIGYEESEQKGDPQRTVATLMELFQYGREVRQLRRAKPTDDLMSQIANAEVEGERLTDEEFCWFWMLLIIAGNETTRNSLSGAVIALQQHDLWQDFARPESLTPAAIEELLRYVSPVMQFRRTATTDLTLGDQHIRAGDKVVLYYGAANRDPAVFAQPHNLVLSRDPNPHLAFGIGPHFCLGTRVARLQMATMLNELVTRFPYLKIDGEIERTRSTFIAGVNHLPVRMG